MRNAKMNGISLFEVQEIAYISMAKAGVYSRDCKWIDSISELEKVYFCAWLLQDDAALFDCEILLMRACFEAGSLTSAQRFADLIQQKINSGAVKMGK